MVGIYKITNIKNGSLYVGCSNNIKRRFSEHKSAKNESSISRAIRKYGVENFKFEIIEECMLEELDEKEKYYIKELKPRYNRSSGGKGNSTPTSKKTRQTLREKAKQQWERKTEEEKQYIIKNNLTCRTGLKNPSQEIRDKIANTLKKYKYTNQHRQNISKGLKNSNYIRDNKGHYKPIICIETGETFQSVKEAMEKHNLTTLVGHLKGRYSTCKGKHYEYL